MECFDSGKGVTNMQAQGFFLPKGFAIDGKRIDEEHQALVEILNQYYRRRDKDRVPGYKEIVPRQGPWDKLG